MGMGRGWDADEMWLMIGWGWGGDGIEWDGDGIGWDRRDGMACQCRDGVG